MSESETPQAVTAPKEHSKAYKEFYAQFESTQSVEEKIQLILAFMRKALQGKVPVFRDFWQAQRLCLPLFKETLDAIMRSKLWGEYTELSKEVRRLKATLDEQASFAAEQIDLALTSMEQEIEHVEEKAAQLLSIEFPKESHALQGKEEFYTSLQTSLSLLNQWASRLSSLRKEVLASTMRAKLKTSFLERLSKLGDRVYPKRKELVEQISTAYIADVDAFIAAHFGQVKSKLPFYTLKDEIKALQGFAKQLSLSSAAFNKTRESLSKCWDNVRAKEQERKKMGEANKPSRPKPKEKEVIEKKEPEKVEIISQPQLIYLEKLTDAVEERIHLEIAQYELLQEEFRKLKLSKTQTLRGKSLLGQIADEMLKRRKETEDLQAYLEELAATYKDIKDLLEECRKTRGGSALSFEESMIYHDLVERNRARQEEIEAIIEEVQDKMHERG